MIVEKALYLILQLDMDILSFFFLQKSQVTEISILNIYMDSL